MDLWGGETSQTDGNFRSTVHFAEVCHQHQLQGKEKHPKAAFLPCTRVGGERENEEAAQPLYCHTLTELLPTAWPHNIYRNITLPLFSLNTLELGPFLQPKFYFLLHPNSFSLFRNKRLAAPYQGQAGEQSWVHSRTPDSG